ncbi:MAG: hypothetical protein KIT84_13995 [Labilithrix sp.]|nr:hypothetical protein [Labilithrix sp.]MCW5812132.1 hypothetical protein [Labilithrix sp.]
METTSDGAYHLGTFSAEAGIETQLIVHDEDGTSPLTSWSVATTVKADGSTTVFDALVFHAEQGSVVIRYDEPQFWTHGAFSHHLAAVPVVEFCGVRAGTSASLPPAAPPPPSAGATISSRAGGHAW